MLPSTDRIAYLRQKAKEMQTLAQNAKSIEERNALLSQALGYDALADAVAIANSENKNNKDTRTRSTQEK